jgi:pyruvate decarboxylase
VNVEVSVPTWPAKPINLELPQNPEKTQKAALKDIISKIEQAKNPIILVDACAIRRNLKSQVHELIEVSGFPTYVTPMGKGAVDEAHKCYRGAYAGNVSYDGIKKEVHEADLILEIGALQSDFNTGGFTYRVDAEKVIAFHSFSTTVFHATYEKVGKFHIQHRDTVG